MSETIYRKVGRRYVPCAEYEYRAHGDMLPYGTHVTVVEPGIGITRYQIQPDKAALVAALELKRDQILAELKKATEARPGRDIPLTPKQAKAWRAWQDACGSLYAVEVPAIADAFDAIVRAVQE